MGDKLPTISISSPQSSSIFLWQKLPEVQTTPIWKFSEVSGMSRCKNPVSYKEGARASVWLLWPLRNLQDIVLLRKCKMSCLQENWAFERTTVQVNMFSNIANYLRGVNGSGAQEEILSVNAEIGPVLFEGASICEYNAVDADDDWVIVDKSGDHAVSSEGSTALRFPRQPSSTELRPLHRTPSASSLPSSFEESWFLTPPPCFTSTGPVHMETSSLENLLIEHPSMSVYQQRPPPPPLTPIEIVRCESVAEFDEGRADLVLSGSLVLMVTSSSGRAEGATSTELHRPRGGASTIAASSSESCDHRALQMRSAQKVQQKRACQVLKRSQLDRNNKARELNSRNRIQRRSDRMLHHSGANNNRKC